MGTYLVTGGAGFIGSHIVEKLISQNHTVKVLDNFSTGKRENIAEFEDKIQLIEGDIRDIEVVRKAVDNVDYVLHQAALTSVPRSIADPISTNSVNVNGTLNVLIAARGANVKRVVYASSSSVYGNIPILPKAENMTPQPLSPYAITKLIGEHYCQVFYALYGLETVCLRYFNVFGPRQDPSSQYAAVIPKFIYAVLNGGTPVIYGDGEQSRDFTYIDNVAEANLLAAIAKDATGKIFNIACGKQWSLNKLLAELKKIVGRDLTPVYTNPRSGDVRHSLADISQARLFLNYQPRITFEEGLQRTFEWFQANGITTS